MMGKSGVGTGIILEPRMGVALSSAMVGMALSSATVGVGTRRGMVDSSTGVEEGEGEATTRGTSPHDMTPHDTGIHHTHPHGTGIHHTHPHDTTPTHMTQVHQPI